MSNPSLGRFSWLSNPTSQLLNTVIFALSRILVNLLAILSFLKRQILDTVSSPINGNLLIRLTSDSTFHSSRRSSSRTVRSGDGAGPDTYPLLRVSVGALTILTETTITIPGAVFVFWRTHVGIRGRRRVIRSRGFSFLPSVLVHWWAGTRGYING